MNYKHLLTLAILAIGGGNSWAQWTDITNGDGLAFSTKTGFGDPAVQKTSVYEIWTNNASAAFDLNQTVASLPAGIYELSANAMYRASLTYGTATNCVLYANIGGQTFSTPIKNYGDCTASESHLAVANAMVNHKAYGNKISYIVVEADATNATIGMKSNGALTHCTNGYWFIYNKASFNFKNVTSEYYAKLKSQAEGMVNNAVEGDAKTNLQTALTTYSSATVANVKGLKAAINTYLWVAASDETPIDITSNIENPSFEGGRLTYWYQDFGYKQPNPAANMAQPNGWDLVYSGPKVNNCTYQSFTTQEAGAKDGNCLYVRHKWSDVAAVEDLRQSISELPAGKYQLTVAVKGGSDVTDANYLTLKAGTNSNTTTVDNFDKTNYKDYSVSVVKLDAESTLDICYGFKQQTGGEQLYYVDDFRLYYLGNPLKQAYVDLKAKYDEASEPEGIYYAQLKADLQTAKQDAIAMYNGQTADDAQDIYDKIDAIDEVLDRINTSKADYANLKAQIDKSALYTLVKSSNATAKSSAIAAAQTVYDNGTVASCEGTISTLVSAINALNVEDDAYVTSTYQYGVELGTWTKAGSTGDMKGQHWSDDANRSYMEQSQAAWGQNSWSINYNQNITLPAGNYVFKVAGRRALGNGNTLSLVVKKGEDVLGQVNDFPEGDVGLGINKDGVASFDPEDPAGFANNGNGRAFQWRFVKFALDELATVNVAVDAQATVAHQWVSFGDAVVMTDNEANISMIAYNIAKNDAQLAYDNNDYSAVVGSERTDLLSAIEAVPGLTKDEIDAAKEALKNATTTFTDAKPSYIDLDNAKTEASAENYGKELPYASATKFDAIATAVNVTPTSAADAATKAAAIRTAYRAYIESNAMAEGVDGAVDMTSLITNPNFETDLTGWTSSQSGGSLAQRSSQSPTTSDGKSDWGYYDYNNDGSNNQHAEQTIENLPAGQYIMTIAARAPSSLNPVRVWAVDVNTSGKFVSIDRIGNTGGAFGRGWNDYTVVINNDKTQNVKIGVQTDATFGSGNKSGWFGFTRVRLVKIADAATMAVNAEAKYGTFVAPFDVEIPVGVTAYTVSGVNANDELVMAVVETTIPANTPVVLNAESGLTATTFYDKAVDGTPEEGILTGTYSEITAPEGSYILLNQNEKVAFYLVGAESEYTAAEQAAPKVGANRAYLTAPSSSANVRAFRLDNNANAIEAISAIANNAIEAIYNANGVKVNALQKGINVVKMQNGKTQKVLVK